jgi:DNA-binding NarL/FixJ family response regulator
VNQVQSGPDLPSQGRLWRTVHDDLDGVIDALRRVQDHPDLPPALRDLVGASTARLTRMARRLTGLAEIAGAAPPVESAHRRASSDLDGAGGSPDDLPAPLTLSPREREVLLLITEGLSNREIAISLGVGPATAKTHVQRLLAKLHVPNRTRAAILATRLGLLD